jgi:non-homologous end joining protein Ku
MAPRAYWKGALKLWLVTCPVALYPASTQAETIEVPEAKEGERKLAKAAGKAKRSRTPGRMRTAA